MTTNTTLVPLEQTNEHQTLLAASQEELALNPAAAYLMSLGSERSRQTMRSFLNIVADMLGAPDLLTCQWSQLRRQHVQAILAKLRQAGRAPATINTYLAALKGVALEAWTLKQLDTDSYQHIKQVRAVSGSSLGRGRALGKDEIKDLICTCESDTSCRGVRDAAIISIMLGCGLRRSEVVALNYESIDWAQGSLVVLGKGRKQRVAYMPEGSRERLQRWVEEVRGNDPGPLFTRIRRYDDVTNHRLSDQAIYYILQERRLEAALDSIAPHDLRRTFATTLLKEEVDIRTVQRAMGHANIATTAIYDLRDDEALRQASQKITTV